MFHTSGTLAPAKGVTIIKLDLEKEIGGIYLFDPKQKPKKVDITAIAEEFKEYTK